MQKYKKLTGVVIASVGAGVGAGVGGASHLLLLLRNVPSGHTHESPDGVLMNVSSH